MPCTKTTVLENHTSNSLWPCNQQFLYLQAVHDGELHSKDIHFSRRGFLPFEWIKNRYWSTGNSPYTRGSTPWYRSWYLVCRKCKSNYGPTVLYQQHSFWDIRMCCEVASTLRLIVLSPQLTKKGGNHPVTQTQWKGYAPAKLSNILPVQGG